MPTVLTHKERTESIEESKATVGRVLNNTRDVRVGANWGAKDRMPRSDGGAIPPQESRGGSLKGVALAVVSYQKNHFPPLISYAAPKPRGDRAAAPTPTLCSDRTPYSSPPP